MRSPAIPSPKDDPPRDLHPAGGTISAPPSLSSPVARMPALSLPERVARRDGTEGLAQSYGRTTEITVTELTPRRIQLHRLVLGATLRLSICSR
jgi:hypothetical protein